MESRNELVTRKCHSSEARNCYYLGKTIGKGEYGTVVAAKMRKNRNQSVNLACKIIDLKKTPINHPNIIETLKIINQGSRIFIFMRYAVNGDLLEFIKENGCLEEDHAQRWFVQMLKAVSYLHSIDVAHRDLKCENILISSNMNVKITDFGFARYITPSHSLSQTFCGSTAYAAPEIIRNIPYDPTISDAWSLGVILFIMLNGIMPFKDDNIRKLLNGQLVFTNAISVSHLEETDGDSDYFSNQTERQRRLIPYMTFYIPTANEYHNHNQPNHQQYALMPLQKIQQMKHILAIVKQQPSPSQGQLLASTGPTGGVSAPSAQPQNRPMPFSNPAKFHSSYQEPRPQLTLLYNIRNPSPAPPSKQHHQQQQQPHQYMTMTHQNYHNSENQFMQQPQSPHQHQKVKITPFLPTNKLPGHFTPILTNSQAKSTKNFNSDPSIVTFTVQPQLNQQQQHHFPSTTLRPIYTSGMGGGEEQHQQKQERHKYVTFLSPENIYTVIKSTASPSLTTPAINYHDENDLDTRDGPFSQLPPLQDHRSTPLYATESPLVKQNLVYITKPKHHLVTHKGNYGGFIPLAVGSTTTTIRPPPTSTPTILIPASGKTFLKATKASYVHDPPFAPSGHAYDDISSSTQLPPPRQHLTEVTQIQPPHLTTYHPTFIHHKAPEPKKIYDTYHQDRYQAITPAPPRIPIRTTPLPIITKNDFQSKSLAELLKKLQESNQLPQTLTSENIDNSIKTLIKILNNLKQEQNVAIEPAQHQTDEQQEYDDDYSEEPRPEDEELVGPNSGRPGIDFPNLSEIPQTSFSCKEQRYKGFFGDPETNCQVWHYCDLNGGQASFLCPNGTIFSQVALTCDWWFNVKCSTTAQLYVLNERLYKYILPFTPKFPEDYSGPLVDKYLAIKFQEMEEKMRKQKQKGKHTSETDADSITGGEDSMDSDTDTGTVVDASENETEDEEVEVNHQQQPIQYTSTIMATKPTPATVTIIPAPHKMRTIVESEQAEVVEIKSDGSTGHLHPSHSYQ
ncbi:hypothetical protein DMENIID0001_025830 [Sergentomyia squamirostris]